MQTESRKCLHAEGQKRLADMKPRKLFALKEDHAPPGAREQRSGNAPGWPTANDSDIVHVDVHPVGMLANYASFGRDTAPLSPNRRSAVARLNLC